MIVGVLSTVFLTAGVIHSEISDAASEGLFLVAQPLSIEGPPPLIVSVPYVGYTIDWQDPAAELMLTTEPNVIWCDGKPQDRNYASLTGFRFVRETTGSGRNRRSIWPRLAGDTLLVKVDLTKVQLEWTLPDGRRVPNTYLDTLLEVTLWCGLKNARSAWPEIRYVDYTLVGDPKFNHLGGLYSLEKVSPPEPYGNGEEVDLSAYRAGR